MVAKAKRAGSARVSVRVAASLFVVGLAVVGDATGCSSSSGAPPGIDASADVGPLSDAPTPPLGVPVSSCAGCPVCAGTLGSATTGISYCTVDCTSTADCPSGTGCVANATSDALSEQCLATCQTSADCTAPFICRSDLATPGNYCWSPYPPPVDGGAPAGDGGDAGPGPGPDAASTDAAADTGAVGDTGAPTDASASDASAD
jgi:hypothetical protein